MTTEKSPPKKLSFLYGLTLSMGLLCGGTWYHNFKTRELLDLAEAYELNTSARDSMCSEEGRRIEEWCEDNYEPLSWKNSILHILPSNFDYLCHLGKHNRYYYQRSLQQFLSQVDTDKGLHASLEEKTYSSEDEIIIDIQYERGQFSVRYSEDPSDPLYRQYLTILRNEPSLQDGFQKLLAGEEHALEEYGQTINQVLTSILPGSELESTIQENILQSLYQRELNESLVSLVETGALWKEEMRLQSENIELTREAQALQESIIFAFQGRYKLRQEIMEYYGNLGRIVEQEKMKEEAAATLLELGKERKELVRQVEKLTQEQQDQERRREEIAQAKEEITIEFWNKLGAQLIRDQIHQIMPAGYPEDSSIIAFGHTHPQFNVQEELGKEHGPSPLDEENSYRKPGLIFTAFPDRWMIHGSICGETKLLREYPRTHAKSL